MPTRSWRTSRIIPAYAGSTPTKPRPSACHRDHPRIRGEHLRPGGGVMWIPGSSPHTRGAPSRRRWRGSSVRIIPAYAGSTRVWRIGCLRYWDHPRIRGEHKNMIIACVAASGSSPHTRGAPGSPGSHRPGNRIIPAYAGSTMLKFMPVRASADHPRIRGEHWPPPPPVPGPPGSSPHTRGAPQIPARQGMAQRIIPAYAGSTVKNGTFSTGIWDHPRIRGEHRSPAMIDG